MSDRRTFFSRIAGLGMGLFAGTSPGAQKQAAHSITAASESGARGAVSPSVAPVAARTAPTVPPIPVETPDLPKLPFKIVDGVKEFHLTAEVVHTEFMPGREVDAWGFNGSVPGPTIEFSRGERVRIVFENRLPEMTAVHWHGFEVPMEVDGSVGLGQDPIPPGGKHTYEFTLDQDGTFFYHSHFAMQEMMGMLGLVVVHPNQAHTPRVDRDFGIILQEWALLPNNTVPNTLSMEFNWLTFNGKSGPATTPMLVKKGERVRIRMVNIGMDHHPIHLHGNTFYVTGTEAGRCPEHTWIAQNTVLVGVAQARDIEFEAKATGDWMLHCHLPHHMMNQMASMVGPVMNMQGGLMTGGGMNEGMGMLRQGNALAEEFGPTFGRGLGIAADHDRSVSNLVGTGGGSEGPAQGGAEQFACPMHPDVRGPKSQKCPKCGMALTVAVAHTHGPAAAVDPVDDIYPKDDAQKKKVPGYPQDMWMPMDGLFNDKPENHGLRKGWSGAMMGMMTLVRVLSPERYDEIMKLKAQRASR